MQIKAHYTKEEEKDMKQTQMEEHPIPNLHPARIIMSRRPLVLAFSLSHPCNQSTPQSSLFPKGNNNDISPQRPRSPIACHHQSNTSPSRRHILLKTISVLPLLISPMITQASQGDFVTLPCEGKDCRPVEVRDFKVGTGQIVQTDSTVVLKWTGRLADRYGWPFQQEAENDVTYRLGRDKLISGFVQGITGMREGGKRRLLIPSELGYRDDISGPLPNDFGDRRRLFATVLNKRRFKNGGDLVIDVLLKKVRLPSS